MAKALIIYVTAPTRREASKIAQALVSEKLAACVSILPGIDSRYHWQGKIEHGRESLLMIKTLARQYKAVEKRIRELHSYTVPEILALPVLKGNPSYLKWLRSSVVKK